MRSIPRLAPAFSSVLLLLACGGAQQQTAPDESGDLDVGPVRGPSSVPTDLDGTRWRWTQAHCTEGPLDLLGRGYAADLRVSQNDDRFQLTVDQQFATESCSQTVVIDATPPGEGAGDWHMEESARVADPPTRECFGRPEDPRPGTVRMVEGRLEVLIQRSQWCNGLEVRMVYERAPDDVLEPDAILRRYVAHFTRGDAHAMAELFAEQGSLLEPFTRTETGDPYRHDGRGRVAEWFRETFSTAPWRAMRLVEVTSTDDGHQVLSWEYMDPRLAEPMSGRTRFTIAAGEIFEAAIELTEEPTLADGAGATGT